MELIPSSEMITNYWVGWVGQSYFWWNELAKI